MGQLKLSLPVRILSLVLGVSLSVLGLNAPAHAAPSCAVIFGASSALANVSRTQAKELQKKLLSAGLVLGDFHVTAVGEVTSAEEKVNLLNAYRVHDESALIFQRELAERTADQVVRYVRSVEPGADATFSQVSAAYSAQKEQNPTLTMSIPRFVEMRRKLLPILETEQGKAILIELIEASNATALRMYNTRTNLSGIASIATTGAVLGFGYGQMSGPYTSDAVFLSVISGAVTFVGSGFSILALGNRGSQRLFDAAVFPINSARRAIAKWRLNHVIRLRLAAHGEPNPELIVQAPNAAAQAVVETEIRAISQMDVPQLDREWLARNTEPALIATSRDAINQYGKRPIAAVGFIADKVNALISRTENASNVIKALEQLERDPMDASRRTAMRSAIEGRLNDLGDLLREYEEAKQDLLLIQRALNGHSRVVVSTDTNSLSIELSRALRALQVELTDQLQASDAALNVLDRKDQLLQSEFESLRQLRAVLNGLQIADSSSATQVVEQVQRLRQLYANLIPQDE